MGSKCSILNDTEHDVWITHGIHWPVLFASVTAALLAVLIAGGIALAAYGVEGAVVGDGGLLEGSIGTLTARLEQVKSIIMQYRQQIIEVFQNIRVEDLSIILQISREEAEKLQADIKDFQASAKLIKPGEKYTWSGSLSLVMKVYVMNDKLQLDDKGCFTGPTAGSENVYPISEYFKKLDVAN